MSLLHALMQDSQYFGLAALDGRGVLVQANSMFLNHHPALQLGACWSPLPGGTEDVLESANLKGVTVLVDLSSPEPLPTVVERRGEHYLLLQRPMVSSHDSETSGEEQQLLRDLFTPQEVLKHLAGWVEDLRTGKVSVGDKHLPAFKGPLPTSRQDIVQLVCEEDRPRLFKAFDDASQKGRLAEVVVSLCHPSGRQQAIFVRLFSRNDEAGVPRWLVCACADASALMGNQAASGGLLLFDDVLQKVADVGTWEVDLSSQEVLLDERMARILELAPGMRRLSMRELLSIIHPDDRPGLTQGWNKLSSQGATKSPESWTCRVLVNSAQGVKYLRGSHRLLAVSGEAGRVRVLGTCGDITELKQMRREVATMRERLELVVDVAQIGVWEQSFDPPQLKWNEHVYVLLGLPPSSVPEDDAYQKYFEAPDRSMLERHLESASATQTQSLRLNVRRADGQLRQLSWRGKVLVDGQGRRTGAVGAVTDVTELVHAERLAQEKAAIEFSSRAKSELLTRLSHELRTPLNAILGFAQLMEMREPDEVGTQSDREFAENIHEAGSHLLRLVNEVLELASIDSNDFILDTAGVDLKSPIQTVLKSRASEAVRANVRLAGPTNVVFARCDEVRLMQVLETLISNAIRYNRPGGSVEVRVTESGEHAIVEVADTGIGMTKTQLSKLFQPFERMAGSDPSALSGAGLSLVIARRLVEKMAGTLELTSTAGVGTRVLVRLPKAEATEQPQTDEAAQLERQRNMVGNVLYVEDNMLNVLVMKGIVALSKGVKLFVAQDLTEAVEVAKVQKLDLVLVDLLLPDSTGYEVRESLIEAGVKAPFIAVTANVLEKERTRAQDEGFAEFWAKPLDAKQVRERMASYL